MLRFLIPLVLLCGAASAQVTTPPPQRTFRFELTEAEADVVMRALIEQPFRVVAPVIQKLQQQFAAQRPTMAAAPDSKSDPRTTLGGAAAR